MFSTSYDQILVPVPAYSTLNLKSNIVQYKVKADFTATFDLIEPSEKMRTSDIDSTDGQQ